MNIFLFSDANQLDTQLRELVFHELQAFGQLRMLANNQNLILAKGATL